MKRIFSMLAFSGLVALGLTAGLAPSQASALSATGVAASAIKIADASTAGHVVEVNHRRGHWNRRYPPRRIWRHHRPRSGFFFEFGTGVPRYRPPVYSRPRYVAPRAIRLPPTHVRWCYARYRSYRAADNSFQPYNGPRRACISPYWR